MAVVVVVAAAAVVAAAGVLAVVAAAANYFKGHRERKKVQLSLVSSRVELELGSFEVFSVFATIPSGLFDLYLAA